MNFVLDETGKASSEGVRSAVAQREHDCENRTRRGGTALGTSRQRTAGEGHLGGMAPPNKSQVSCDLYIFSPKLLIWYSVKLTAGQLSIYHFCNVVKYLNVGSLN